MAPGLCGYGGWKAPQSSGSARGEHPRWALSQGCTRCLCRKVFHKLGLSVSEEEIRKVVVNTPGAIEPILCAVRDKVEAGEDPPGTAGHVGTVAWPWPLLCWDAGLLPAMRVKPGSKWGRSPVSPCLTCLHPFSEALGSRLCCRLQGACPPAHL